MQGLRTNYALFRAPIKARVLLVCAEVLGGLFGEGREVNVEEAGMMP